MAPPCPGARSGLKDAVEILDGVEGVAFVRFDERDVVRHGLVTRIVRAYDRFEGKGTHPRPEVAAGSHSPAAGRDPAAASVVK